MQEVIRELEKAPPILEHNDLLRVGLYRTISALRSARARGNGPPEFRLGPRTTRYDREEVIEWLRSRPRPREKTNANTEE